MIRRTLALAACFVLLAAVPAVADPQSTPNGPWVTPEQELKMSSFHTYEELVEALHRIERSSAGTVELEVIGQSVEGRDLYLASVGTGPREVLYITQQHGNEVHATEAALGILRRLSADSREARDIREQITLRIIVRVNPDGTERFQRRNADGLDLNRFHDPDMAPEDNPAPESAAVRRVHDRFQPDLFVDYHNQGSYRSDDGDLITMSLFVPNHPDIADDVRDKSKQLAVTAYDSVQRYGHGEVSKYPGGPNRQIADTAYALLGSGSLLVESRGQVAAIGQKSSGMLIRQVFTVMWDIAAGAADGSLDTIDPARADEIPDRGRSIRRP